MITIILIGSIVSIVVAHILKVYRWKQMIEIYEEISVSNLINALSLGYFINYLLPYRIGDIARAIMVGKKMKNGVSFSLATIVLDRIMDVIVVAVFFGIFYLVGYKTLLDSMLFYIIGAIVLVVGLAISLKYNKYMKMTVKKVASVFNEKIELGILKFTWSFIQAFKDLIHNSNKIKIGLITLLMWILYLISYGLFALCITKMGNNISVVDVFMSFFSKNNLDVTTYTAIQSYMMDYTKITLIYIMCPIVLLFLVSYIVKRIQNQKQATNNRDCLELLPHNSPKDRLIFLEAYFSGEQKEYFQNYLKINRDISILQDFSAGSNATTMLCSSKEKTFFRKYSIGEDSKKLQEQISWIEEHRQIPLVQVIKKFYEEGYCYYDMPYLPEAINCFNYIHSKPVNDSWTILEKVLKDLENNLYKKKKQVKKENVDKYIRTKVIDNIKKIEKSKYIKDLLKYENLIINGKKYKNLLEFKKYFTYEYLYATFENDEYTDIHGDLTIENIICLPNHSYYLIDPNTGNIHNSPNLDYAKLLQSLHGGYEFLMKIKTIRIDENQIDYLNTESLSYKNIYLKYDEYLNRNFTKQQVKSIYFHEIVHWIRLLPYKIRKDEKMAVLFYCGFIMVMNEIIEKYTEESNEAKISNI